LVRCADCSLVYLRDYASALLESHGDDFVRVKVSQLDHEPSQEHTQLFEARLARAEAQTPGRRVLDVGCGNGAFLLSAKRRGWRAFGLDNSVVPAELLAPHGIEVSVGDAVEYLRQQRAGFDLIHMNHSLEHIPQAAETLLVARDALAPGGVLHVEVPNELDNVVYRALALLGRKRKRGSLLGRSRPASAPSPHLYFFNRRSLRRLAQRAGFSSIDVHARRREAFDFSATEAACSLAALLGNGIFLTLTATAASER
jgi:SAM-dependent methyltransferase